MKNRVAVLIVGGFLASLAVSVAAQATRSVNEGVYTADQAKRGEGIYKEQCATCHGDNLEGSGPMPPLAGKDFLANWTGKSAGDVFEKVTTTMPATAPGTLTPAQGADLLAYMFSAGKYPAGGAELDSKIEVLAQVKIDPPKAP